MPLVVPGITDNSSDATQLWTNKLVGKTVSDDTHSETVSSIRSTLFVFLLLHFFDTAQLG